MKSTFRIRTVCAVLIFTAACFGSFATGQDAGDNARKTTTDKWAKHYYDRVAQFEQENTPQHNVVIVGSSHVEGLDAARLLPRWRVVNRGISSDRIGIGERGILHRLDNSVFYCDPSVVVLQNGANDLGELWRHGSPSMVEIETCYRKVVQRIRGRLPDVPLIIVGLFPTRDKYADLMPFIVKFDVRLKDIAHDYDCTFLEVYPSLADSQGLLRKEYSRDGLHLTKPGYRVWARLLNDALVHLVAADETALDPATALREPESDLLWYDARQLVVEGKGWTDTENFHERLPARAKAQVPEMVWALSKRTAGLAVRFSTDSKRIAAIWDGGGAMNHMAATGNSGLDLYCKRKGRWVFCGAGRPQLQRTTADLATGLAGELTEYLLYLPLYSGVTELRIGIEPEARMVLPPPRPAGRAKPLVFYGTSITQGGCASRAGMCHPAILGRWFNREVLNLGFSGSGKMEPELAHLLGELDAAIFVLECLPNMTTQMVRERVRPFVRILRAAQPATPILLVESPFDPSDNPGNQALRNAFANLTEEGVSRLYYLPGESQLAGTENGTVDGVHPTDLGFYRMAVAYEPILRSILDSSTPQEPRVEHPAAKTETPERRAAVLQDGMLTGFERSPHFDEQIKAYTFEPDVSVQINAPSAATFDPRKPTRLVLYALPNGNTIAQTIGRQRAPDVDWHFFIQHIGAQTRRLREVIPDANVVVAYVEAGGRSWPAWRRKHADEGALIARLIESVKSHFAGEVTVDLTGHSGGGSLIFGYLNHVDQIPDWIRRIVWLDANYAYSDEQRHGDKLIAWLQNSREHFLGVVAYDDRAVRYEGKLIVGPTGGTYRKTQRMLDRLGQDLVFSETLHDAYERCRALDGRVDIVRIKNPENKILHTVLVEKNGFIHALTFGTPIADKAGELWGPAAYTRWIQPE